MERIYPLNNLLKLTRPTKPVLTVGTTLYCDCNKQLCHVITEFNENLLIADAIRIDSREKDFTTKTGNIGHFKLYLDGPTLGETGWEIQ